MKLTPAEALAKLPGPGGARFTKLFTHGAVWVLFYGPEGGEREEKL